MMQSIFRKLTRRGVFTRRTTHRRANPNGFRRASTGITIESLELRTLLSASVPRLINSSSVPRIVNGTETDEFPAVGIVHGTGDCTGSLIAPDAVLTAAHCLHSDDGDFIDAVDVDVQLGGNVFTVTSYDVPDTYDPLNFDIGDDLGILHLNREVTGITPLEIARTPPRIGQTVTLVGFGDGGTSTGGLQAGFGTKRVGQTTIDDITQKHIIWFFDSHQESNTASGDSGGPALLNVDGVMQIVGVTSGGDGNPAVLGDRSFDTRIDVLAPYIDSLLDLNQDDDPNPDVDPNAGVPTVISLNNKANPLRPAFVWSPVANADSYDVYIGQLSDNSLVLHAKDITSTVFQTPQDLGVGSYRYWVRAITDNVAGPWSRPAQIVISTAIELTGPDGRTPDAQPTIRWNPLANIQSYEINFRNLTDGTVETFSDIDGAADRFQIPDPLVLGRYRVSIRATDAEGREIPWSQPLDFTVVAPPEIVSPIGSTFSNPTTFTWEAVLGATRYELYVDRVGAGQPSPIISVDDIKTNRYTATVALPPGDYTFWVRAFRERDVTETIKNKVETRTVVLVRGNWSDPTMFSLGATAVKPVVTGPMSPVDSFVPTISWSPVGNAARYDVWVNQIGGKEQIIRVQDVRATSFKANVALSAGEYRVWVRAISTKGEFSSWSEPFDFVSTGGVPTVIQPVNGNNNFLPTIVWTSVPDAVQYDLWVDQVGGQKQIIRQRDIVGTEFTPSDPLIDGRYVIYVRAISAEGISSDWSDPFDVVIRSTPFPAAVPISVTPPPALTFSSARKLDRVLTAWGDEIWWN